MLALCLFLSMATLGIMMLLYFESKDNKRLNSLLDDYRTRRYKDEQTLAKMEELITTHKDFYRETVNDYKSIIVNMTDKIKDPLEKLKSHGKAAKPAIDLKDFSKKLNKEVNGLKEMMLEGPEVGITE